MGLLILPRRCMPRTLRRQAGFFAPMAMLTSDRVAAVDFGGSDEYLTRGANLTGSVDGKQGTFSCWARFDGGDGTVQGLLCNNSAAASPGIRIVRASANTINVTMEDSLGSTVWLSEGTATLTAGASWHHILVAWSTGAEVGQVYIDGTADPVDAVTSDTLDIDYTTSNWAIGGETDGGVKLDGCLAEAIFHTKYIDPSSAANMRKFRRADGGPADLGTNGSGPFGERPLIYLRRRKNEAVAAFAVNRGTGGNFTINGTLGVASSSPSD